MLNDWNIKSRSDTCQISGTPFQEGDFFYTLLFCNNNDEYERLDVSEASWKALNSESTESSPFPFTKEKGKISGSWRSKYELPPPPPPEPLKKDDAEGMLRYFLASTDPQHLNASYILALMLERKKIFKALPSADSSTLLYEHTATGETFIIKDPHLSLENLAEVQQEVSALLQGATRQETSTS